MAIQNIDKFGGLYTAADKFSTPGSPAMNDWDIDLNDNLVKTKGYTRVEGAASTTASAYLNVTNITVAASAQAMIASANWFFSASSPVVLYGFGETTFSNVVGNKVWNIVSASATGIELEGCDTSSLSANEGILKAGIVFNDILNRDEFTNYNQITEEAEINSRTMNVPTYSGTRNSLVDMSDYRAITNELYSFWVVPAFDNNYTPATVDHVYAGNPSLWFTAGAWVVGYNLTTFGASTVFASNVAMHIAVAINNTASLDGGYSSRLWIDGASIAATTDLWASVNGNTNTYIGNANPVWAGLNFNGGIYGFTQYDLDKVVDLGLTEASAVTELYSNTFNDGIYKFEDEFAPNNAKADPSMQYLHGFVDGDVDLSDISCQGAYYDSTNDIIYSFLANEGETKSYLVQTDKDTTAWRFSEGSNIASATAFGTTHKAWFDQYGSQIIFTKNETQGNNAISLVTSGGLFYIQGSGQLKLYGAYNNPTGKYLETHKDRIWVGNITALSGQAQNGNSWVQVSKFLPEATDTRVSIVNSGIIFGTGTAEIKTTTHTFKVGDEVYLSGIVFSYAGSGIPDDMNQRLHSVVGLNGTTGVNIEYNNVNDLIWSSGGDALLRGATWGTSLTLYDDLLQGAGIFKCDNNENDAIMQLQSSFGSLAILREQNPYMFTGAIESGNQTLARPLNVPYSTVSPFVYLTAGGVWFVSQYGVSKIEGTTIKTNQNQLDNIVDLTVAEPIKPTFDEISTKSGLIVYGIDRRIIIHDPETNITLVFDTLKGLWYRWYDRLVDRLLDVGEDVYSVYKHLLFKLEDGNQTFSLEDYEATNMRSSYLTRVFTQESMVNTKIYNSLFSLLQGTSTSSSSNPITINVYYNGEATPGFSFSWDVKTGTLQTWDDATTSGTVDWDTATTTATVLWRSLYGNIVSMLQQRKYRLGAGQQIQFEIIHSDDSSPKISKLFLDYDMLDVDTIQ